MGAGEERVKDTQVSSSVVMERTHAGEQVGSHVVWGSENELGVRYVGCQAPVACQSGQVLQAVGAMVS